MSEQSADALRRALDEMDRLRKRSLAFTRFLIYTSIVFLVISFAIFLLRGDVALGMPYALLTLYTAISGCAINLSGTSYANTQKILRAIESLSREKPND
jgi:hypothetical protein